MKNQYLKTKRTPRQNGRLMALWPAALLLAGYTVFFAFPAQKDYLVNRQVLDSIRLGGVDAAAAETAKNNLQLAQHGLQKLNEELTADRYELKMRSQNWRDPDAKLDTVKQVTRLLRQFNLSIVFQDFETEPVLSNYLQELTP